MTKLDTYDILKYGHVPIQSCFDFAKEHKYDFSHFTYDDIEEKYFYSKSFRLLWDGDFYYIDCLIIPPCIEMDEHYVTVNFYHGLMLNDEEYRNYPILFPDNNKEYVIKCREDFVQALNNWDMFVYSSIGIILRHRNDIIKELDSIIKYEHNVSINIDNKTYFPMSKSNKKDYMKALNRLLNNISDSIDDIVQFKRDNDEV